MRIRKRALPLYVAPGGRVPAMCTHEASRAFVELREALLDRIATVSCIVLGSTPSPTAAELIREVRAKTSGARPDIKIDQKVADLNETMPVRMGGRVLKTQLYFCGLAPASEP